MGLALGYNIKKAKILRVRWPYPKYKQTPRKQKIRNDKEEQLCALKSTEPNERKVRKLTLSRREAKTCPIRQKILDEKNSIGYWEKESGLYHTKFFKWCVQ